MISSHIHLPKIKECINEYHTGKAKQIKLSVDRITIKKMKPCRNTKGQGDIQSRNKIKRMLDKTQENQCQMDMLPSDIESKMFVWDLTRRNGMQTNMQASRKAKLNKINNNQRIVIPGTTKADKEIDPPTIENIQTPNK